MAVTPIGNLQTDSYGFNPPEYTGTLGTVYGSLTYETTTSTAVFQLPAGAVPVEIIVTVTTGFTDTGTDVVIVGTAGNDDAFVDDIDVTSAGVFRNGDTGIVTAALYTRLSADEVVYVKYTGQNGNADAGAAVVEIRYLVQQS